jgi:hypothetical protein
MWSYDNFLYEMTYVKHLPNYQQEFAFSTYPLQELNENKTEKSNEQLANIPFLGRILFLSFPYVLASVPILLLVVIMYAFTLFIREKMYSNYRWWITQLVLIGGIVLFILNTQIMD